jgi:hypothetical protein
VPLFRKDCRINHDLHTHIADLALLIRDMRLAAICCPAGSEVNLRRVSIVIPREPREDDDPSTRFICCNFHMIDLSYSSQIGTGRTNLRVRIKCRLAVSDCQIQGPRSLMDAQFESVMAADSLESFARIIAIQLQR